MRPGPISPGDFKAILDAANREIASMRPGPISPGDTAIAAAVVTFLSLQ